MTAGTKGVTTAFATQATLLRANVWRYFDGLTDDELHWEPAPGMWGVRLKTELRTPLEDGAAEGPYWMDTLAVPDADAPFTTIAWRVAHLTLGTWNWNAIIAGHEVPTEPAMRYILDALPLPQTAGAAKSRQPAFGGDAGAGQHGYADSVSKQFAGLG